MLAPIDKLRTPAGNRVMQIIITHRCNLSCSNCTQGMGYVNYDMSVDVFRQAVRSVADWPGTVALFGRNPVMHPRFADICAIMREEIPEQHRRGLWCNDLINDGIGAICRETFYPQGNRNLNAHGSQRAYDLFEKWLPGWAVGSSHPSADRGGRSLHAAVRVAIQDFIGSPQVPDEEAMWRIIEGCDINRDWSAAIYERDGKAVASFCEIAAADDIHHGANHGIPVEPGWWRWGMERFDRQHKEQCRRCGVPLKLPGVLDSDGIEQYSATHEPLIQLRNRVKKNSQKIEVLPEARKAKVTSYIGQGSANMAAA